MQKREFLKTTALVAAGLPLLSLSGMSQGGAEPAFTLPALPYPKDALEPYIDKQTMELHHDKHHQAYVDKVNAALKGKPEARLSLEALQAKAVGLGAAVRNNGGGHYNHSLFWTLMAPFAGGPQLPDGNLALAMNKSFGTYENFKTAFAKAAMERFGSGWAWLVKDSKGSLLITSTANQDNPLMGIAGNMQGMPILGLDVWEHAYYLTYQNRRAEYVEAFWNVLNWKECEKRFG